MYVSSYFNIVDLLNGNYIFSHTYLGGVDLVEEEYARYLINCKISKVAVNEFKFPKEIFSTLVDKGYLVEDLTKDKKNFLKVASKMTKIRNKNKSRNYTLILSYECNFRCGYCFELKTIEKNKNNIMSKDTIDVLFERIDKELEEGINIFITLFGGEPFLPKNKEVINYILAKAKNKNIKINAITNGYYLDYYKNELSPEKIDTIQVTLDGDRDIHDKRRILKSNIGTFDKIFFNIGEILKNKNSSNIRVRINVDKRNVESLPKLLERFDEEGFTENKNFMFYTKCVHNCYTNSKKRFYDSNIVNKIKFYDNDKENMRTNSSYMRIDLDIRSSLDKKSLGFFRTSSCGAGNGMLVIDSLGDVYACYEEANNPSEKIGDINYSKREIQFNERYNEWSSRVIENIEECSNCSYSLLCGGGCAKHAKVENGMIDSSNCDDFKKVYADTFRRIFLNHEY